MKRYLSKRVWSVVLAAAGLFTAPLCAPLQAQDEAQIFIGDSEGDKGSIQECINKFPDATNAVIKLQRDVDINDGTYLSVSNGSADHPVIIDLNGKTLTCGESSVIQVNQGYGLTIRDSGSGGAIVNTQSGGGAGIYNHGGAVTIEGGSISGKDCAIHNTGTLTIDGAPTFKAPNGYGVHNEGTDGTLVIDGAPKFDASVDIYIKSFVPIGIGDNFGLTDNHKITIGAGDDDHFFQLTSGYGERMRYQAGNAKAGKVIPPSEFFALLPVTRTDSLAFAGGEVWVAPSGTLALVETPTLSTVCTSYNDAGNLATAVSKLTVDATVTLTADVAMNTTNFTFQARDKHFTLDLGGHEISSSFSRTIHVKDGALLDIIDSGGGGYITNTSNQSNSILNSSVVSIPGGVTIKSTGSESSCIFSTGGTTTFKGWPTFELGARTICVLLNQNDVITFTDDISAVPAQKISVSYYQDKFGKLTSGYGAHVRYPAGHDKQGEPIDPDEVFTYKRYGTLVASVHPKLVGTGDAAEAELWMPTMAVAYIDENGVLHNDLDHPGGTGDDDAALAYILDGTENTLGEAGSETWYVAQGTLNYEVLAGRTDPALKTYGDVHIILADGAVMTANSNKYGIYAYKDDNQSEHNGHLYIHSQGGRIGTAEGKFTVSAMQPQSSTSIAYGIYCDNNVTITGGDISVTATNKGNQTSHGLGSVGNLTISGGKLNIIATTEHDQCDGIHAKGTLNIGNAEVTASATCKGSKKSYGIYAESGLTFDKGKVTASGVTEGSGMSYGIYANTTLSIDKGKLEATGVTEGSGPGFGIWANGAITSTSAEVTASGYCIGSNDSYGIYAENTLSIDKGTVTATGKTTGSASSCGILAQGATTFYDAVVKAEAETDGDGSSTGIRTEVGNLTINKGNVTAIGKTTGSASSYGINIGEASSGNLSITGGTLTANGQNDDNNKTAGIKASTITLDWSDASDEIMASSYDGTVTIPAGRYFAALKDDGTVGQIYGKAATDGDYTFSASDIYAIAGKTLHPVAIIPSSGEEYIGYSEQEGDMAIIGGTAKTYAVVGYDLSASPAVVYVAEVSGLPKGSAVVLGPATDGGTLPNEVAVVVQSGSAAAGIESSFTNAKPLANFIAAPADGTTPLDKQIAQAFSTSTPSDYLAFMLTGGQFRAVTRTATTVLPANSAVLAINKMDILRGGSLGTKPSNARCITLGGDDGDMTGIKSIENGALGQRPLATEGTQEWYSIDGRKMNQAPKAKGIYIHNGTKYVVR